MEILTGEQMRRVDRRAIDGLGIPSLLLMEAAGRGVADALLEDHPVAARDVLVVCGKGHNGGDGLVAARWLAARGARARVLLLGRAGELSGDPAANLRAARAQGLDVREVPDEAAWSREASALAGPAVVLDAILGTGVHGGARGLAARAIESINAREGCVASIDLPSGIDADVATVEGPAVRASVTYTLVRPKLALVFEPAARHAGRWRVISIGIPDAAVAEEDARLEWLDRTVAAALLPQRAPDTHKGTYGHVLAVAGSRGKSGAAVLVGRGALRAGAGLVTVATPSSSLPLVAVQQVELMTEPLAEDPDGGLGPPAAGQVVERLLRHDALAVGPGLGTSAGTSAAVRSILEDTRIPTVIDADALNALAAAGAGLTGLAGGGRALVLTPHPGEAARLLGTTTADVQEDRLDAARRLAEASGGIVVLKGHRTLVASPEGRVAVNSNGNPGMASAGVGDALTGILTAFLARGLAAWDAARLAVFVHGDAGDRAARSRGADGMIASDLLDELPHALAALAERNGDA